MANHCSSAVLQPNILFVMADQLPASALGCYGNPVPSTPTLDRLASMGVRYDRHFSVYPVCGPARATIFTGRHASAHGVFENNVPMNRNLPHITELLRDSGYRTGGFGKFHFEPMDEPLPLDVSAFGFDESVITEDPKVGPWLNWIEAEHPAFYDQALALMWPQKYHNAYERDRWQRAFDTHLRPRMSREPYDQNVFVSPLPAELTQTVWITDHAIRFVERTAQEHGDQPWFCYTSYVTPHDPYDPSPEYADIFRPEDMPDPLPKEWRDDAVAEVYLNQYHGNIRFAELGPRCLADYTPLDWKRLRAHYHGNLKQIDDQFARLLDRVDQLDNGRPTVIVFTTDHGEMLGDHGLLNKGTKHYDSSIRCPLIIVDPRDPRPGTVVDRMTSIMDFFPTFCQWGGIETDRAMPGRSLLDTTRRNELLIEFNHHRANRVIRTLMTDEGERVTWFSGQAYGELFQLREDPDEQRNLYHDPAYASQRADLLQCMVEQMTFAQHDVYVNHYR